jgi:hypothetical protein
MALKLNLRFEKTVDYFLSFMLLVKFVFLISSVGHIVTVHSKNPKIQQHEEWLRKVSETTEMIFVFGMSIFLIYYFIPSKKTFVVTRETAVLLFAYGIVMLFGAVKRYHLTPPYLIQNKAEAKNQQQHPTQSAEPIPYVDK